MAAIGKFGQALEVFRHEVKADVKVQHLHMLVALMIHSPEPLGYADIEKVTGNSISSISRASKSLGTDMQEVKKGQWVDKGLGLVEIKVDPYNTKAYLVGLSSKGLALRDKLNKVLA